MPESKDIMLYWADRKRYVVFSGYQVPGAGGAGRFTAYITAGKRIAIYDHHNQSLWVHENFDEVVFEATYAREVNFGWQLVADIAAELGIAEWAAERLDI
jgi:hypothetical protein